MQALFLFIFIFFGILGAYFFIKKLYNTIIQIVVQKGRRRKHD